ncbi:putative tetratricopeptide-like helical domain superfamily, DYW domain-containing protein [Helianthus annuus]|nr:putative tetratricopeptide-like helical domain superfamily, DYW domain-containing protein [Helianthus annuus]KAJ0740271.1 putative tetratricopeptide-like helical domain superfamily, DYW domain-containing protein [Helianthus annuus]
MMQLKDRMIDHRQLSLYHFLLIAGHRIKPLQQVHAQIIVSGKTTSLPLLTKLITSTCASCASTSIIYTHQLLYSISNPDSFLFSSLIKTSTKHNFPRDSLIFYRHMLACKTECSNHTLTAVIKACGNLSALGIGKIVHCHVLVGGYELDLFVQAALVSFYAKCGELGVARKVFDEMPQRSLVAWNAMISGYEQNGLAQEAIGLFECMRDLGVEFDLVTMVSVLSACSQVGALGLGQWIHEYINRNNLRLNTTIGTSLINMYGRCGDVIKAREVFESLVQQNVITWTAMISVYGMHGYGKEAMEIFHLMKLHGPPPNSVTFIAVLSACAHAGLVSKGQLAYTSMIQDYQIAPKLEHHVSMVDMLGRAGLLNEAYQHIHNMNPIKPTAAVWTAMLGACKMHKNITLGVVAAENLLAIEPHHPGHFVLISNIYAMAGQMDRVEMVRNVMIQKGLKKQVGYATIEVDNKTYLFSMGDMSHPETDAIYRYLDELMERCREVGYTPVFESVMHEVEEEERVHALRYHSEKLALAFGLLKTQEGSVIRIVKNLRVCEDCHMAFKFISVVTKRKIVVRDKLRFHHFEDGSCSCLDYW